MRLAGVYKGDKLLYKSTIAEGTNIEVPNKSHISNMIIYGTKTINSSKKYTVKSSNIYVPSGKLKQYLQNDGSYLITDLGSTSTSQNSNPTKFIINNSYKDTKLNFFFDVVEDTGDTTAIYKYPFSLGKGNSVRTGKTMVSFTPSYNSNEGGYGYVFVDCDISYGMASSEVHIANIYLGTGTEYEPYFAPYTVYPFDLNIGNFTKTIKTTGLRAVKTTNEIKANYIDDNGVMWISDELHLDGTFIHRISESYTILTEPTVEKIDMSELQELVFDSEVSISSSENAYMKVEYTTIGE